MFSPHTLHGEGDGSRHSHTARVQLNLCISAINSAHACNAWLALHSPLISIQLQHIHDGCVVLLMCTAYAAAVVSTVMLAGQPGESVLL